MEAVCFVFWTLGCEVLLGDWNAPVFAGVGGWTVAEGAGYDLRWKVSGVGKGQTCCAVSAALQSSECDLGDAHRAGAIRLQKYIILEHRTANA